MRCIPHPLRLMALALVAAVFAAACGGGETEGGGSGKTGTKTETLQFGLLSAFSGSAAAWGPMEEASVKLAIEDINDAGGITADDTTYMLELKTYDGAYDPTKSVTAARQAAQQDGIKFLEVLGGSIVPAVQPITNPAKMLVFAMAGGDDYLGEDQPYTFRPYYDIARSSQAALEYAYDNGARSVTFLYPDDDLGHSLADTAAGYAEEAGYTTDVVYVGRDVTDFFPVLTKVMENEPDIVDFGPTPGSQYAEMVKQARQLDYQGDFVFSDTVDLDTVVKVAGADAIIGSLAAPMWQEWTTERGKSWAERYKASYGSLQTWTAQAYDNLWLLKAAIEKAGTLDSDKVADALGEVSIEGVLGSVSYGGEDLYGAPRVFEMPLPVVKIDEGGKLEQVYVGESALQ